MPYYIRYSQHAQRARVRVRGNIGLCEQTAKCRCDKDTCCVIKRMRNRPHGQRSLSPQGRGWGECSVWLAPLHATHGRVSMNALRRHRQRTRARDRAHAPTHSLHASTQDLHVDRLKCRWRVLKKTPFCRHSVTNGAVVSLTQAGWRVEASAQERGGE
jgi:hypothetical protein